MICIVKTIFAWVILALVGVNLIGLIVRGFFWRPPAIDAPPDDPILHEVLGRESRRMSVANRAITASSILFAAGYIFALFYFWNGGLALAAGIIMAARMPDLIWKIRTDKKVNRPNLPKGPTYIVAVILLFASLALVWYSLCNRTP
jgi:hypothetical protein